MTSTHDTVTFAPVKDAQTSCRSRVRQVLERIDGHDVPTAELEEIVDATSCIDGHGVLYADLARHLVTTDSVGIARMTRPAQDWLDRAALPSPHWERSVHRGSPPLRAWQVEALRAWCEHGRWGVVEAVTGTGKSRVGVEAVREA